MEKLLEKIKDKTAIIEIIGLGYVGFPLAVKLASKKFNVIGIDINSERINRLKKDQLLVNHDLDSWHETLNINLTSSFYFAKLILPLMMKAQWGRFIFLSSTGGVEGDIGTVSYSTSKTALIGFSKVISKEYSRFNITSNILSLGTFDTGLFHNLDKKKQDEIYNQ